MGSDGDPAAGRATAAPASAAPASTPVQPTAGAAHLDEDAECLEDPVHCGDAQHQHVAHEHAAGRPQA